MARDQLALFEAPSLPPGFRYRSDVLTPDEERGLLEQIRPLPFREFEFQGAGAVEIFLKVEPPLPLTLILQVTVPVAGPANLLRVMREVEKVAANLQKRGN